MEYDPAVSTHKASSITSTTSTSSSSTWESHHPQFNTTPPSFKDLSSMEHDHFMIQNEDFISDRISLHDVTPANVRLGESIDIKHEYHEQCNVDSEPVDSEQEQRDVTHDRHIYLTSSYLPTPIYLQHGDQITVPFTKSYHTMDSSSSSPKKQQHPPQQARKPVRQIRPLQVPETAPNNTRQRSSSISSVNSSYGSKRQKPNNRDILTDDEKRVNHIASEQKRRNTIRLGFKELTDIIPTLKNINNSKSTILFKAVEYIKHLDKRNRGLREKISTLKVRMNVEGRMMQQQQHQQRKYSHYQQQQQQEPTMADTHQFSHLPANAVSALMAHKNQQKQLEALQEQLRLQQQLLAKHHILPEHLTSPPSPPSMPSSSSPSAKRSSFANHLYSSNLHNNYNSISIPSSRSSNSDDNDHVIIPHHSH
ncbi:uncharacterized protein ATC70_008818 [Mucor velutinosus]|uniref:BHLH domain-containing protein n=1 Tax=Mucor velutinosus TaxID=708070 RepID=A0AAN7HP69_9FUNG|nr:hypothetical protein ATC70_008818 [Mucor velutinosus]